MFMNKGKLCYHYGANGALIGFRAYVCRNVQQNIAVVYPYNIMSIEGFRVKIRSQHWLAYRIIFIYLYGS